MVIGEVSLFFSSLANFVGFAKSLLCYLLSGCQCLGTRSWSCAKLLESKN